MTVIGSPCRHPRTVSTSDAVARGARHTRSVGREDSAAIASSNDTGPSTTGTSPPAAFGAGEIDLAALTDRWPGELVTACQDAYARARWTDPAPPGLTGRLAAARLFLDLRWLSQCHDEHTDPRRRLLAKVRADVEALGLL